MEFLFALLQSIASVISGLLLFAASLIPSTTTPAPTLPPAPSPTASTTATFPTADARVVSTSTPTSQKPAAAVISPTQKPTAAITPSKTQEEVNELARAALVNILCMPQTGLKSGVSGSGVIIDSRGIILTNAHIGQYFLLKDYLTPGNVTCTIRVGSPAEERYTATLLFIPSSWVAENASQLRAQQAMGTGEHDYAFLLITGRTNPNASLPVTFSRLEMDRGYVDVGQQMLLAAYPAGFLSSELIQKSLYAGSAVAYVTQLFSFSGNRNVDLFSIGGTVLSQSGSSGGAVVRLRDGKLAGILVTATTGASTGERDLRALSLAHIDDSLAAHGQGGILQLLTGDVSAKATEFNTKIAPGLTAQLEAVLNTH